MAMFDNLLGRKAVAQGTVIALDQLAEQIQFCAISGDQSALQLNTANYRPRIFDQDFFDRLSRQIRSQQEKNPGMDLSKASLILPDQLFLLDMVSIPIIHKKAMQHSLSLAIETVYKNADELSLMTYSVQQTKQTATFALSGARRDLLEKCRQVFADNGIAVTGITYASSAMCNGAFALNPKLRNDTFLLLDIKENYARFAFVVRGVTMGYYDLPFGHGMLYKSRMAAEDVLFDNRAGELLVLNARERARAKQLTMEGTFGVGSDEESELTYETAADGSVRRSARKLPKFMQRPTPQSRNEFVYENFRIFIKWALDLINNNQSIVSLAKLDKVVVNLPAEYNFLFDMVNDDKEEHGVTFVPMMAEGEQSPFAENLELYGGFFLGQYNAANTF